MKNPTKLQRLRSRIGSKKKQIRTLDSKDALIDMHHILMKEYGWITIDEFKNLPIPTLWNLLDRIRNTKTINKGE